MKKSEMQLDIIPIYENEMFPTKEQFFHYNNYKRIINLNPIFSEP